MSLTAVSIDNLGFSYPGQDKPCLRNLCLEIGAGERFGLFGPNGAGKTTLMNLMTGLLNIQEGHIQLFGQEVSRHQLSIHKIFCFIRR